LGNIFTLFFSLYLILTIDGKERAPFKLDSNYCYFHDYFTSNDPIECYFRFALCSCLWVAHITLIVSKTSKILGKFR
jgi:hypothetical protein